MLDTEFEELDLYLDGELRGQELAELELRLSEDAALRNELESMRSQRLLRQGFFQTLEGDDRLADRLLAATRRSAGRRSWISAMAVWRYVAAAAACLLIGFFAGWFSREQDNGAGSSSTAIHGPAGSSNRAGIAGNRPAIAAQPASAGVYSVTITDEVGNVIDIQRFDSLERAREFCDDLENWQDRLDQLRNGQVTVRSASF